MDVTNPWVQFGLHVFVGTIAGGLSDTVAVWLLFNPKKRHWGIQGAIPKNQARLARSIGKTVGQKLLTASDLQRELGRTELQEAFEQKLSEIIGEIITSRDPLIEKVPPAVVTAMENAMESYLPIAMVKLGDFLGQPTTRDRLRRALHSLFDRFVNDLRFHERIVAKLMVSSDRIDSVLDTLENDGVEQLVTLMEDPVIREEISRTIHNGVIAYLQKPIADLIPRALASGDPEAATRIAHNMAPVMWAWIHDQLPSLVQRLDVQDMVERKVMAFSTDRVEDILRSVIQNELNMIILSGYILGGIIGVGTYFLTRAVGL